MSVKEKRICGIIRITTTSLKGVSYALQPGTKRYIYKKRTIIEAIIKCLTYPSVLNNKKTKMGKKEFKKESIYFFRFLLVILFSKKFNFSTFSTYHCNNTHI